MNKYEQLIEYIINEQEDKARELFHNIVVEKSRDIYESLMDEDQVEENIDQYDQQADLAQDITNDENGGLGEDDDALDIPVDDEEGLGDEEGGDDMGGDMGGDDMDDMGGESDVEGQFQNIKDAIDDLQAEFDKLMGGDEGGSEEEIGGDMGDEIAMEAEEVEEAVGSGSGSGSGMMEAIKGSGSGKSGSGKSGSGKSGSGKSGSGKMTEAEMMREYVEKISAPSNTEGADNKGSVVAGKNDMGGTAANIAKGGANNAPDGTSAPKSEKAKEIASGNINVPGGKAGNAFKTKESAKTGEEGGVNDNSPLAK